MKPTEETPIDEITLTTVLNEHATDLKEIKNFIKEQKFFKNCLKVWNHFRIENEKNFLEGSTLENSSGMTEEIVSYPDRILHEFRI